MLALACAPASALAAGSVGNSFEELTKGGQETTPTTTTPNKTTTTSGETTNSHTLILVAAGAAIVLLVGIGMVIVRDARRVAPAGEADVLERDSARDSASRLRNRRAKAKAARKQRKRNR